METKQKKPVFWDDKRFQSLHSLHPHAYARELYLVLWLVSDDYGIFKWSPDNIKGIYFSMYDVDISETLGILSASGLINMFTMFGETVGCLAECCPSQFLGGMFKV